jgi:hypothetical protein
VRGGMRYLLATVVAAACCTTALAQQEGLRDRDPELDQAREVANELSQANLHYGNFYVNSSIELSDVGYTQQFFVPTSDQGHGISFIVRAPQKLYYVPYKKVVLSAQATPSYAFVSRRIGSNQFGYNLRGDARLLLNHLFLDGFVTRADELRANVGDINRLLTVRDTGVGVEGEFKYSSRTSARFNANVHNIGFPSGRIQPNLDPLLFAPISQLQRNEHNYRAMLVHRTFPLTSLTLAGEHSDYHFRNTPANNSRRNYVAPGFRWDNGIHTVTAEAGPAKLSFDNPLQHDFSGVVGKLTSTNRFTPRVSLDAAASRDVDFSIFGDNPYYVTDRLGSQLNYSATRKLTLHLIGDLGRNRYDVATNGVRRRDNFGWLAAGWLYNFRRLHFGFDLGYYTRTSNLVLTDEQHGIRGVLLLSVTP